MKDGITLTSAKTYTVSIQHKGVHRCGGAVVDKNWVLTSAQCIKGYDDTTNDFFLNINIYIINFRHKLRDMTVVPTTAPTRSSDSKTYKVSDLKPHRKWNPNKMHDDIGLVKIAEEFGSDVPIIPINTDLKVITKNVYYYGWGKVTNTSKRNSDNNLSTKVTSPIDVGTCGKKWPQYHITESQFCTMDLATNSGYACDGDGGNAVISDTKLVGIVSFDNVCGNGQPDVITNVAYFANWISEHMT